MSALKLLLREDGENWCIISGIGCLSAFFNLSFQLSLWSVSLVRSVCVFIFVD